MDMHHFRVVFYVFALLETSTFQGQPNCSHQYILTHWAPAPIVLSTLYVRLIGPKVRKAQNITLNWPSEDLSYNAFMLFRKWKQNKQKKPQFYEGSLHIKQLKNHMHMKSRHLTISLTMWVSNLVFYAQSTSYNVSRLCNRVHGERWEGQGRREGETEST